MTKPTYVYAIAVVGQDLVKIGRSEAPAARLASLQTACPHDLELVCAHQLPCTKAAIEVERDIHEALDEWLVRGEWFGIPRASANLMVDENVEAWKVFCVPGYAEVSTWEWPREFPA